MSILIKMERHDMYISVDLSTEDGYYINNDGFLSTLEEFIQKLDLYENVSVEIKRVTESDSDDSVPEDPEDLEDPEDESGIPFTDGAVSAAWPFAQAQPADVTVDLSHVDTQLTFLQDDEIK